MSYLEKPATPEEALAHFGVKGMRWGVRKRPNSGFSDDQRAAVRAKYGKRGEKRVNKRLNKGKSLEKAIRGERNRRIIVRTAVVLYAAMVGKNLLDRFGPTLASNIAAKAAAKNGARAAADAMSSHGITSYQTVNVAFNAAKNVWE